MTAPPMADGKAPPAPDDPLALLIADLFAETLALDAVAEDDNFFVIGGDSLSAATVIAGLGAILGREFAAGALFDAPTPLELSDALRAATPDLDLSALNAALAELEAEAAAPAGAAPPGPDGAR